MIAVHVAEHFLHRTDSYMHIDACRQHRSMTTCAVHYDLEVEEHVIEGGPLNIESGELYFRVGVYRRDGKLHLRDLGGDVMTFKT